MFSYFMYHYDNEKRVKVEKTIMDKKFISIALKKFLVSIIVFINVIVTVICVYFPFYLSMGQRQYVRNYQNENARYFRDSLTFWIVTSSVIIFLVMHLILTINWNKGKDNSKRKLVISTLTQFVMITFFTIRYFVDFQNHYPTITLIISTFFLWTTLFDAILFMIMKRETFPAEKVQQ